MTETSGESSECVSVRYDDVPRFLRSSAFYKGLSADGDQSVPMEVPRKCFKADDTVNDSKDLRQLLQTMIFWGLDVFPESILDFCHGNDLHVWNAACVDLPDGGRLGCILSMCYDGIGSVFPAIISGQFELVRHWIKMHPPENLTEPTQPCSDVALVGNLELLIELHEQNYLWDEMTCNAAAEKGHLDCLVCCSTAIPLSAT